MFTYKVQSGDIAIDYHAAYEEGESYKDFVRRVAEQYFPGQGQEWIDRYEASLHFYGIHVYHCEKCDGKSCPQYGHRFFLVMKKGTSLPIPYAHEKLCSKYVALMRGKAQAENQARKEAANLPQWNEPDESKAPVENKAKEQDPEQLALDGFA